MDFLVRRDLQGKLYIASLQGATAQDILPEVHRKGLHSLVLVWPSGELRQRSSAVFAVAGLIGFPFAMLNIFKLLPRFFTDWVYGLVAKNRYVLFGRRDSCRLPTDKERSYFLD